MSKPARVGKPIWVQISLCGFAAVLLCSITLGCLGVYNQYNEGELRIRSAMDEQVRYVLTDLEAARRTASALALQVANHPGLGVLTQAAERDAITTRFGHDFSSITANAGPNVVVITDATGRVVGRLHDPLSSGDTIIDRPMVVSALQRAAFTSGNEVGRAGLGVYAIAPIMQDGKLAGLVDTGITLSNAYFGRLRDVLGAEIAVEVARNGQYVTQNTTAPGTVMLSADELAAVSAGRPVRHMVVAKRKTYAITGAPIRDFERKEIGIVEVATDVTSVVAARRAALWTAGLTALGICCVCVAGFLLVARRLGRAITRLNTAMQQIAAGQLGTDVPGTGRGDEIGAMARTVEIFKQGAVENARLEQEAKAMRAEADETAHRNEAARAAHLAQQSNVVETLASGLSSLAGGDLTCDLNDPFAADYEALRGDFNAAAAQLRTAVAAIASNTDAIYAAAGEISGANDDLSRRTEQQAATLEQTAAALDLITTTVTSTAKAAASSSAAVQEARADAERSGEVVRDAVAAMGAIKQSSHEIGNIIGVIDEIAFQTSLLALNAGVEAARAGDSGRGFAVVASEVRALAQRSANAAKEIKALILASGAQVERGVSLVGQTGGALDGIVTKIAQAASALAGIAASAQEQAAGLQQVNTGVTQMDQVTQQNAAMAEQTTAASHALRQQAETLTMLTGKFRIANAEPDQTNLGSQGGLRAQPVVRATPRPLAKNAPPRARAPAMAARASSALAPSDEAGWEEF